LDASDLLAFETKRWYRGRLLSKMLFNCLAVRGVSGTTFVRLNYLLFPAWLRDVMLDYGSAYFAETTLGRCGTLCRAFSNSHGLYEKQAIPLDGGIDPLVFGSEVAHTAFKWTPERREPMGVHMGPPLRCGVRASFRQPSIRVCRGKRRSETGRRPPWNSNPVSTFAEGRIRPRQ